LILKLNFSNKRTYNSKTTVKIPFLRIKSEVAIDPVCNMKVNTDNPPGGTATFQGNAYYFCGTGCRVAFEEDPQGYISGEKSIDM
jgi:YHS domain-containing protein